jgi:uncharacterized protein YdhG (YjbR/CyaY superfamily)
MHEEVEKYLCNQTDEVRKKLKAIRDLVLKNAPDAVELFSYGMPAYKLNGRSLIYFAVYKKHIGLYATASGHKKFFKELSNFKQGKGSVQFPLNKDLPMDLIEKIIQFKVDEISSI